MKRLLAHLIATLALAVQAFAPALAGSDKPLVIVSGQTRQLPTGDTLQVSAATTGNASINIPPGIAPTSPVNGDLWVDGSTLNVRAGGTTIALGAGGGGGGSGTVTSVSVATANGVSGSVATSTTTPAITLTLGAITPSSVAASGTVTGSNLSGVNTGDQNLAPYLLSATAATTYQPLDADLTTYAGITPSANVQALLSSASYSAFRTNLGVTASGADTAYAFRANNLSDLASASSARTNLGLVIGTDVEAHDADLTAIAALAGTSGFVKKTAANTYTLDTSTYLTGNQTITLTGDTTGSGTTSIATTTGKLNGVALSGLATGILKNTTGTGVPSIAVAADFPTLNQNTTGSAASFTGSLAGDVTGTQGATVAGRINGVSLGGLATGILKNTTTTGVPSIAVAADFPTLNQNTTGSAATLTTGRTISISGDLTYTSPAFNGSGNVTAAGTLATVNSNTGTFGSATQVGSFTVNAKGLITAASNVSIALPESAITSLTADLAAKQSLDTQLTDLAALSYTANALKVVRVNSGGTAFELAAPSGGGDVLAANNLSEYTASASTARSNLGLGSAATQNTGTSGATLPLLNGANTWSGVQTFGAGTVFNSNAWQLSDDGQNRLGFVSLGASLFQSPAGYTFNDSGGSAIFTVSNAGNLAATGTVSGTNLTAGGNTTGNAATATKLATARTISITGKATSAGCSFDGSAACTLNITAVTLVAGDIPAIAESGVTSLPADLAAKAPLGNPVFSGTMFWQQAAPTAVNASATLTGAQVLNGLFTTTSTTAVALTLPTGTAMDTAVTTQIGSALANDRMMDFYTINLGSSGGAITMTANTGFTIVGSAVCPIAVTCHWGPRKTASNTYVLYRLGS